MFRSLLFVLSTLGAEPVATTSLATCVRPAAMLAAPKIEHVAGAARSTDCHQIAVWLRRWEQLAKRRPALSAARRDALRHKVETDANAHAAAALELMTGPLDIARLRESFAWTITDRDADRIQLEAIPRDDTERLFYASIRVWLDEDDGALNQLQVTDRSGETRFVWRNNIAPEPSPIQFASAIEEATSLISGDELPSPSATDSPRRYLVPEADCENLPLVR